MRADTKVRTPRDSFARHRHLGHTAFLIALLGCSGEDKTKTGPVTGPPTVLQSGAYSYQLSESTGELALFTAPATQRLTDADRAPTEMRSGLRLSAAKREFEPVQLAIGPAKGTLKATVKPFANLSAKQRVELYRVEFVDGMADRLVPLGANDTLNLTVAAPSLVWVNVYVPEDAQPGLHTTTLVLSNDDTLVSVPIELTVFDFTLPAESHFATQFNISVSSLTGSKRSVSDAKTLLFEHRLTPTSATWPSGLGWPITWDNPASPNRCKSFYDEPDEGADYAIGELARRYLLGQGWNGVGFNNAELFQFVDNATPRPNEFCGIARGDHYGTAAYNAAWSSWLSALDGYLVAKGLDTRGYYYVQNEPQNAEDARLAAHLCRLSKAAAPHLRIAVSEEPKREIAEDAGGECGYDIWIAHVRAYEQEYAWQRQRDFGEEVWFYSLDQDPDPYFNPTHSTSQGINQRIIPWTAWSHRIRGWAYYDGGRFFSGSEPTVRAELLREGLEDYEYLWLANAQAHPIVFRDSPVDATVHSVAASMTSFTRNADALMTLRHELGRYIEGARTTLPTLEVQSLRPKGAYYVNFQDPNGNPTQNPLVIDGKTYLKVGWQAYDAALGYGWYGEHITDSSIALYGFDAKAGYSVLEQSYVYDDYGRDNLFEFDLAPGRYQVTVAVGRPAKGYPNDPHNVTLEGVVLVDDEPTSDETPVLTRTTSANITDGKLSLIVGGRSRTTGDYAYTFLSRLEIEPLD